MSRRKPWAHRAPVSLYAFARVTGPTVGKDGCGVAHYAVRLDPPMGDQGDHVGRVSARILRHGGPVRHEPPLYAVGLAFELDLPVHLAGGCVAELAGVRPAALWPKPEPSGLLRAYGTMPGPSVLEAVRHAARCRSSVVRLDSLCREAMLSQSYTGPAGLVRAVADALDDVRPGLAVLGGVTLVECSEGDDEPAAYRWPRDFLPHGRKKPGGVESCATLAALAVGVALRSRLPTAEEVAAWMDEDKPETGEGVE